VMVSNDQLIGMLSLAPVKSGLLIPCKEALKRGPRGDGKYGIIDASIRLAAG